jgi:hypothetical protein
MRLQLLPAQVRDVDRVSEFLGSVFNAPKNAVFLDPRVLSWKYFQPRTDWTDDRSFLLMDDSTLVAHIGVWPLALRLAGTLRSCVHLIDWAATRKSPGAGVWLYRELLKKAETALGIGGTEGTRKLLPKIGFREVGRWNTYRRAVRPWKYFQNSPGGWKEIARLLRDSAWNLIVPSGRSRLEASPIKRFDAVLEDILSSPARAQTTSCHRTQGGLNYLLDCPVVKISGYLLHTGSDPRGYFLLSRLSHQARIAELRISSSNPQDWVQAVALACAAAAEDSNVVELFAGASSSLLCHAIRANGFRLYGQKPVFFHGPQDLINGATPLDLSFIDSDSFLLE